MTQVPMLTCNAATQGLCVVLLGKEICAKSKTVVYVSVRPMFITREGGGGGGTLTLREPHLHLAQHCKAQ